MGKLSSILTALFCAVSPLASGEIAEVQVEQTESKLKLGKQTVASVRSAYEKGEYDSFLSQTDEDYKRADLSGLIEMRQKQIPVDFQEKWEEQFSDLQKKKNRELLNAVSDQDDSMFAEKVRSLAGNIFTADQEKAISRLNSFVVLAPKGGANDDENRLIDLDLEYEYKLLHAQLPMSDVSPQQQQEYQLALRMEKMDKMAAASKSFQDLSLKQAVSLAAATLDVRLARNLDGVDLNALVRDKVKPSNSAEEKVYSILSSYQGQFADLMKDLDQANR